MEQAHSYKFQTETEDSKMILELLYNGRIYPAEAIMSQDERFVKAEANVNRMYEELHSRLSEPDKKQLEQLREEMYESQFYAEEEHFRYGLTLGMMLVKEIYEYGARYFKDMD